MSANIMTPTLRRILLISAFVLVTVGFLFVIWYLFFRNEGTLVLNNSNGSITNGLPTPSNGNVNATNTSNVNALPNVNGSTSTFSTIASGGSTLASTITTDSAGNATVNTNDGNLQFYDRTTGQFFKVTPNGDSKTLMTDDVYPQAQSVTWAPSGSQAILNFPDGSNILYDFTSKKQTTLPSELANFSFSPQSDKIASKYLDPSDTENQWLVVSKPDGTQSQSVEHLGQNAGDVTVSWSPNNQVIAMYASSINANQQEIIFLGANNENYQSVNVNGRGFTPAWSPDGRKLLYSVYSPVTNDNPHLFITNGSPDTLNTGTLDVGLDTSADKCSFAPSGNAIYCGVPYYYNPGSGPQPSLSSGIPDNIYKIDLRTGTVKLIARPVDQNGSQRFSVTDLQVASDESALFFRDATTGTIQRVQLR